MEVSYNVVLVVEERPSSESRAVAACRKYILGWTAMGCSDNFVNKFNLPCSNHVPCPWYIVEHAYDVFVLYPFLLDPRYQEAKDALDAAVKKYLKLVEKCCAYQPGFAPP
jgi:hypothetical protein